MRETGKEANEIDMEDVFEGFREKGARPCSCTDAGSFARSQV